MYLIVFIIFVALLVVTIKLSFDFWKMVLMLFLLIFVLALMASDADAREYSPEEVVQIGKIVQHEAPHESELGQRLVIDTILNRVESEEFPNTVAEVIGQPGQYCNPSKYPPEKIYRLVADEIYTRTNARVLWYRTKKYHKYGEPIMQEGSHYFSGR